MAEAESTTQLDILGILATDKGMTGENISREIFSYVDCGYLFSNAWADGFKDLESIFEPTKRHLDGASKKNPIFFGLF